MADQLPEAKLRVRLETSDAERDSRKLEADEKKRVRGTKEDREKEAREARREELRRGRAARGGGLRGRALQAAGLAVTVAAAIEVAEFVAPFVAQTINRSTPEWAPWKTLAEFNEWLAVQISDALSDVKAAIETGFATAGGVADVARARLLLEGGQVEPGDVWEFAKTFYNVTEALNRAQRQRKKLTREVFAQTLADLVKGTEN